MSAAWRSGGMGAASRKKDPASHVHMSAAERRHYRRGHMAMDVSVHIQNESFDAIVVDVSVGGAQVRSSFVPRIGVVISMTMQEFGCLNARVVRRLQNSFAVEFDPADPQFPKWAHTVEKLLKNSPPA